jgi:hypothetical protein
MPYIFYAYTQPNLSSSPSYNNLHLHHITKRTLIL